MPRKFTLLGREKIRQAMEENIPRPTKSCRNELQLPSMVNATQCSKRIGTGNS